jgi:hypothetical protein
MVLLRRPDVTEDQSHRNHSSASDKDRDDR